MAPIHKAIGSLKTSAVACLQVPHVAQLAKEALANTDKEQCVVIGLQSTGDLGCSGPLTACRHTSVRKLQQADRWTAQSLPTYGMPL
jgi:hypothetical protein